MKRFTTASLALAFFMAVAGAGSHEQTIRLHASSSTRCERYTAKATTRYAQRIYSGTRTVPMTELRRLGFMESCQRYPNDANWVRHYDRLLSRKHTKRIALALTMNSGTASWYTDSGSNCCGFNSPQGVAVCGSGGGPCVPMGTKIEFRYEGRTATCIADDHGPYVAGRAFDLDQGCAAALGFSGVGVVQYRIK